MNYAVQEIIKKRKITEYLRSKHILPIGSETSGRFRYKCPLHEGDNTPSFIVYTNSDFENFFCYGCKAKYHIIHLYRELEKISTEEAIKRLSDGLSLNLDSEMDFIIKDLENDYSVSNLFTPIDLSLVMSRQLYDYTKQVDKDTAICDKIECLYEAIDNSLLDCDINKLNEAYKYLPDVIAYGKQKYSSAKEEKIMQYAKK